MSLQKKKAKLGRSKPATMSKLKIYSSKFKEPTEPLPPITTRGKVRRNRLYVPEENIQRGLELIRQGVYVSRAAQIADVPIKRMHARCNALRVKGELSLYWGKNAPQHRAPNIEKGEDESQDASTSADDASELPASEKAPSELPPLDGSSHGDAQETATKKKKNKTGKPRRIIPYDEALLDEAAQSVREGLYTINAAKNVFKVSRRALMDKVNGKPRARRKRRWAENNKLTYEQERELVSYILALKRVKHLITVDCVIHIISEWLSKQGQEMITKMQYWWVLFRAHHKEINDVGLTRQRLQAMTKYELSKNVFDRLTEVFDAHNFHAKPSRVYTCHWHSLNVARWEKKDELDMVHQLPVQILVATNAPGYQVLPPCVIYGNEFGDKVTDFFGLSEAGFINSDCGKITADILVEWFRSVFLQYIPVRSADDPVILIMHCSNRLLSPELLKVAEEEHVHLVLIDALVVNWLQPLLGPLKHLMTEYEKEQVQFTADNRDRRVIEPFFPVMLNKIFGAAFNMLKIQEAFEVTGIFPLKPASPNPKSNMTIRCKNDGKAESWQMTPWQTSACMSAAGQGSVTAPSVSTSKSVVAPIITKDATGKATGVLVPIVPIKLLNANSVSQPGAVSSIVPAKVINAKTLPQPGAVSSIVPAKVINAKTLPQPGAVSSIVPAKVINAKTLSQPGAVSSVVPVKLINAKTLSQPGAVSSVVPVKLINAKTLSQPGAVSSVVPVKLINAKTVSQPGPVSSIVSAMVINAKTVSQPGAVSSVTPAKVINVKTVSQPGAVSSVLPAKVINTRTVSQRRPVSSTLSVKAIVSHTPIVASSASTITSHVSSSASSVSTIASSAQTITSSVSTVSSHDKPNIASPVRPTMSERASHCESNDTDAPVSTTCSQSNSSSMTPVVAPTSATEVPATSVTSTTLPAGVVIKRASKESSQSAQPMAKSSSAPTVTNVTEASKESSTQSSKASSSSSQISGSKTGNPQVWSHIQSLIEKNASVLAQLSQQTSRPSTTATMRRQPLPVNLSNLLASTGADPATQAKLSKLTQAFGAEVLNSVLGVKSKLAMDQAKWGTPDKAPSHPAGVQPKPGTSENPICIGENTLPVEAPRYTVQPGTSTNPIGIPQTTLLRLPFGSAINQTIPSLSPHIIYTNVPPSALGPMLLPTSSPIITGASLPTRQLFVTTPVKKTVTPSKSSSTGRKQKCPTEKETSSLESDTDHTLDDSEQISLADANTDIIRKAWNTSSSTLAENQSPPRKSSRRKSPGKRAASPKGLSQKAPANGRTNDASPDKSTTEYESRKSSRKRKADVSTNVAAIENSPENEPSTRRSSRRTVVTKSSLSGDKIIGDEPLRKSLRQRKAKEIHSV